MSPALLACMGRANGLAADPRARGRVRETDLYDLSATLLETAGALLLGMHCDQLFLADQAGPLEAWVRGGGRVAVCGQIVRPFLPGLTVFRPMAYAGVADLTVHRLAEHPVWRGVRTEDLTFRKGVAGFYGRGSYEPPAHATVVHGLGPDRLPLDFTYRLGDGAVLVHGGNDLWGYRDGPNSAARMTPQLLDWLVPE